MIEVRELTKRYGEKLAVSELSFDVEPGRVTGFLGPNGAGKSTTMRLIMGLDYPSAGTATINGHRYHDLAWPLREVGGLLEAKAIHPGRSAFNHLLMLAQTNLIPRRRVSEVLDLVGLASVAKTRVGGFSLGMGQRLGIAVALLGEPETLLFDEPTNGLDTDGIRWVRGLLRDLAAEGRTILVSSHLMAEMALTVDQVIVVAKGRLVADMPIDEFTSKNSRRSVIVRSPQIQQIRTLLRAEGASTTDENDGSLSVVGMGADAIGDLAALHSLTLHELATQSGTLEEAFVESTEGNVEFQVRSPSSIDRPDKEAT